MLLILVRAGECLGASAGLTADAPRGPLEASAPLSLRGIEQAAVAGLRLAKWVKPSTRATFWSPPQLRSLQTARIAQGYAGCDGPITIDGRLGGGDRDVDGVSDIQLHSTFRRMRTGISWCPTSQPEASVSTADLESFLLDVEERCDHQTAVLFLAADCIPVVSTLQEARARPGTPTLDGPAVPNRAAALVVI